MPSNKAYKMISKWKERECVCVCACVLALKRGQCISVYMCNPAYIKALTCDHTHTQVHAPINI